MGYEFFIKRTTIIKIIKGELKLFYIINWLINLIILYTSLIDYSKCIINLTGDIDSFKRFILVYRLDCFIVRAL
jgi:hypothetical protein